MKTIISIIISLITMVAAPLVAMFYAGSNDAIGIFLLFLVILNPIVSIVIGIISGGKKVLWYLPVINAAIYLVSYGIIIMFDITLIISAAVYIALGLAAAYITKAIKTKNKKENIYTLLI